MILKPVYLQSPALNHSTTLLLWLRCAFSVLTQLCVPQVGYQGLQGKQKSL